MDVYEAVMSRRVVRGFTDQHVATEVLRACCPPLPCVSFSHGQCAISLPQHRDRLGGQSRSMFDFTRFDDGDIAEQAAVGNNPRRQRPHNGGPKGE